MKGLRLGFIMLALFVGNLGWSQPAVINKFPLGTAYIPTGFDSINKIQIAVEGVFNDSCYKVGPHHVTRNGDTIVVTQGAYVYDGICTDMIDYFYQIVEVGLLPTGRYNVVDGSTGKVLGILPVAPAPRKSRKTYPDNYLYAPVTDASLLVEGGKRIVLSGAFTDTCTHFTEIRVQLKNNVIEVLPITERAQGQPCQRQFRPFEITRPVSIPNGHYLLHVRVHNGNAISKVIDVFQP